MIESVLPGPSPSRELLPWSQEELTIEAHFSRHPAQTGRCSPPGIVNRALLNRFRGATLPSIFVNYRRNDSEGEAGRLFDELAARFGENSVFMDVAAIEPGRDFRKAIDQSVASCTVLLAMIGLEWLDTKDPAGTRRLEDPNDFVRIELASALRRDIPVIPILVRGAKMPHPDKLSDDLRELAFRNGVELSHARWKSDVQVLIRALQPYMRESPEKFPDKTDDTRITRREIPVAPAVLPADARATDSIVATQTVERVGRQLAAYIGPISDVIVRRAAKNCSSLEEFYVLVAREIRAEADRAKFLRTCRTQNS